MIWLPLLPAGARPGAGIGSPVARPGSDLIPIPVYVPVTINVNVHRPAVPVAVVPGRAPGHPPGEADPEGTHGSRVSIVRIPGIVNRWRVAGHVNHGRVRGHHLDDLFGHIDHLRDIGLLDDNVGDGDDLLRCRLEIPRLLSLGPEGLDGVHQFFGLVNEGLAEVHGPGQVRIHFGDQFWKLRDRFDVFVPGLRIHVGNIVGVFDEPRGLNYLEGIGRRGQHDGNEWIRMQRDRDGELLKIGGASFCRG